MYIYLNVSKQRTDVKLLHLMGTKNDLRLVLKYYQQNVFTNHIWYMYKHDLTLNNLQELICHQTKRIYRIVVSITIDYSFFFFDMLTYGLSSQFMRVSLSPHMKIFEFKFCSSMTNWKTAGYQCQLYELHNLRQSG